MRSAFNQLINKICSSIVHVFPLQFSKDSGLLLDHRNLTEISPVQTSSASPYQVLVSILIRYTILIIISHLPSFLCNVTDIAICHDRSELLVNKLISQDPTMSLALVTVFLAQSSSQPQRVSHTCDYLTLIQSSPCATSDVPDHNFHFGIRASGVTRWLNLRLSAWRNA